eukprot:scaffold2835_cov21-Tisochrysis_lutea.AAC.3
MQVPAPLPNSVGKNGRPSGGRKGKGKQVSRLPAGRKDCISTQASACLRFLATCPEFMPELIVMRMFACTVELCALSVVLAWRNLVHLSNSWQADAALLAKSVNRRTRDSSLGHSEELLGYGEGGSYIVLLKLKSKCRTP